MVAWPTSPATPTRRSPNPCASAGLVPMASLCEECRHMWPAMAGSMPVALLRAESRVADVATMPTVCMDTHVMWEYFACERTKDETGGLYDDDFADLVDSDQYATWMNESAFQDEHNFQRCRGLYEKYHYNGKHYNHERWWIRSAGAPRCENRSSDLRLRVRVTM